MPLDRVIVSPLADSDANIKRQKTIHSFKTPLTATEIHFRKKKRWNKNTMKAAGDLLNSRMATIIFSIPFTC